MKLKLRKPQPNCTKVGVSITVPEHLVGPMELRILALGLNRSRYLTHLIRLDLEALRREGKLTPPAAE